MFVWWLCCGLMWAVVGVCVVAVLLSKVGCGPCLCCGCVVPGVVPGVVAAVVMDVANLIGGGCLLKQMQPDKSFAVPHANSQGKNSNCGIIIPRKLGDSGVWRGHMSVRPSVCSSVLSFFPYTVEVFTSGVRRYWQTALETSHSRTDKGTLPLHK